MKNFLVTILTVSLLSSIIAKPVLASSDTVIIYVDSETCVRRGGSPKSDKECVLKTILKSINKLENIEDCTEFHKGCSRREK